MVQNKSERILRGAKTRGTGGVVLAAVLASLPALWLGCGDDAGEPSTTTGQGNAKPGSGSQTPVDTTLDEVPDNFLMSCEDTHNKKCFEYAAAMADADDIMLLVETICDGADQIISEDRCSTDDLVGTCLTGEVQGAPHRLTTFYYEPVTEERAKDRCNGKYESAK
jgi:hypothetical protein